MSVSITVGWLDEMRECDKEGFANAKKDFTKINRLLKKNGFPIYTEPKNLHGKGWGWQVFPPNGIAYLQRLAVYLWQLEEWPKPGTEEMGNPLEDEEIDFAYEDCYMDDTSTNSQGQRFNHLVCHSCRDDYWVPVEFDPVISEKGFEVASSIRLKHEVETIAKMLELPLDLDPRSQEVEDMTRFASRRSRVKWKKYGIESYSCLLLYHAAVVSEEVGAAIFLH